MISKNERSLIYQKHAPTGLLLAGGSRSNAGGTKGANELAIKENVSYAVHRNQHSFTKKGRRQKVQSWEAPRGQVWTAEEELIKTTHWTSKHLNGPTTCLIGWLGGSLRVSLRRLFCFFGSVYEVGSGQPECLALLTGPSLQHQTKPATSKTRVHNGI